MRKIRYRMTREAVNAPRRSPAQRTCISFLVTCCLVGFCCARGARSREFCASDGSEGGLPSARFLLRLGYPGMALRCAPVPSWETRPMQGLAVSPVQAVRPRANRLLVLD